MEFYQVQQGLIRRILDERNPAKKNTFSAGFCKLSKGSLLRLRKSRNLLGPVLGSFFL